MSKEYTVIKFIEKELPDYQWHIHRYIKKARRYPDLYLDLGNIILIIEIDENKHKYYKDEKKSMNDITKALGKPTIFIRFNPDSYYDCNGEFHKSCWKKVNGKDILKNEEEHNNRLCTLTTVIMSLLNCKIDELPYISIEDDEKLFYVVHKLYYDNYYSDPFHSNPFDEDNYEIRYPNSETDSETDSEEEDNLDDDEIQSEHDTDDDWRPNCEDKSESEPEYEDDSESEPEYEDSESDDSDDDCTPPPSKRPKID